jgi:hypothetical protein
MILYDSILNNSLHTYKQNAALWLQDEMEDEEEEVWNGDVGCAEDESEEEAAEAQAAPQNMQRQQH